MNRLPNPCRIIGVLDNGVAGLSPAALTTIEQADLVIGNARTLALFAGSCASGAELRDFTGQLRQVPDWIRTARDAGRRVVVLATGDPLCHGIAAYLQARLCIEACEVLPNISLVQLACARLGMPWQDLKILSVHGPDAGAWIPDVGMAHGLYPLLRAVDRHERLAIFTSPDNTPERIARMLIATGRDRGWRMAVAEKLLQADEHVVEGAVAELADRRFADPNVVLLWRQEPLPRGVLFGLADQGYAQRHHGKGLITKRDIRAVALARLQLRTDSIVWDIGAGSGAVGLEAARLCVDGHVFAIEKNAEDIANARANRERFGITNYTLVHAKAPAELAAWPDPDAIFIGGSGGELATLVMLAWQRLRPAGVLVLNLVTFENLAAALEVLARIGASWEVTQLQSAHSQPVLDLHRLEAANPVWIVTAQRDAT